MPKIILIHGNQCLRWSYDWLPWIKTELEKLGLPVIAETFPDSIIARKQYWLTFLKDKLHADENTILIGHSSGALAAMRYAEENNLLGSVLIGAAHTDNNDELEKQSGYFDTPWQWDKIKQNQQWILQFGSTDDPYIPSAEFEHVHQMLQTEYHRFTDRGHFEDPTFPELLEAIKQKVLH